MKTSYIVIAIVIAVVAIGGIVMLQSNNKPQAPALEEEESMMEEASQSSPTVVYNDEGYSPKELTIKKRDTVTFTNGSSQPMWTASAVHPSHTVYPKTDIKNCGNAMMMDMMFDSCVGVPAGGTWEFQFNETGSWGYHNHLRPNHWGKVIVE